MAVNDLQIKSFDFAADVAKQLITLATAIITVMITFSKDILGTNSHYIAWLLSSWILFLLSIVFGIFTLMALTGVLAQSQKTQNIEDRKELENFNNSGIYKCNVRWFEGMQIFLFIIALLLSIIYGYKSLSHKKNSQEWIETFEIVRIIDYKDNRLYANTSTVTEKRLQKSSHCYLWNSYTIK